MRTYRPKNFELDSGVVRSYGPEYRDYYPLVSIYPDAPLEVRQAFMKVLKRLLRVVDSLPEEVFEASPVDRYTVFLDGWRDDPQLGRVETLFVHKDAPDEVLRAADQVMGQVKDVLPILVDEDQALREWRRTDFRTFLDEVVKAWVRFFKEEEHRRPSVAERDLFKEYAERTFGSEKDKIFYSELLDRVEEQGGLDVEDVRDVAHQYAAEEYESARSYLEKRLVN